MRNWRSFTGIAPYYGPCTAFTNPCCVPTFIPALPTGTQLKAAVAMPWWVMSFYSHKNKSCTVPHIWCGNPDSHSKSSSVWNTVTPQTHCDPASSLEEPGTWGLEDLSSWSLIEASHGEPLQLSDLAVIMGSLMISAMRLSSSHS